MSKNSQSINETKFPFKNPFEKNTVKIESTKPVSINIYLNLK